MWKGLRDVLDVSLSAQLSSLSSSNTVNGSEFVSHLIKSVRRVKETKRLMKEIWEQSKDYRISDRVHMTEVEILQRLQADGVFPWLDRRRDHTAAGSRPLENLHICLFMRR